jgi:hypothetical protein
MRDDRVAEAERYTKRLIAAAIECDESIRKGIDAHTGNPVDQNRVNVACEELFAAADEIYRRYSG